MLNGIAEFRCGGQECHFKDMKTVRALIVKYQNRFGRGYNW